MENNKDFAVFILTHGRADNVRTVDTLKKCGYTGQVFLIVDNEDKSAVAYIKNFGADKVKIFDKKAIADQTDEGNNFDERKTIIYARNACFKIAKDLGITYFMQLDDDYGGFYYKLYIDGNSISSLVKNLDRILANMLEYYKSFNFKSIAFAQGGDFIGGLYNGKLFYRFSRRKCMNSFLCSTERPFQFVGALNEDVCTYTSKGHRGDLFLTIPFISLTQAATQAQAGGITELYKKFGTYCKAFTAVMMHPSGVKISMMKSTNHRIHHSIKWNNVVPLILDGKHKKNKFKKV